MADVQGSALCPGSTPGTPLTGVLVAVVCRDELINMISAKSLFNRIGGHQWKYEPQQCGPSLPGGLYLRKEQKNEDKYTWYKI